MIRPVDLVKPFENLVEFAFSNADTRILNLEEEDDFALFFGGNFTGKGHAALGCEFYRVGDKVRQDLFEPYVVSIQDYGRP